MIAIRDGLTLPDHDQVAAQAIPFDRDRWMSFLPDHAWWPAILDECPVGNRRPRVDRKTVFSLAKRADTAEGRRHLLVTSLVWGSGTNAWMVGEHSCSGIPHQRTSTHGSPRR